MTNGACGTERTASRGPIANRPSIWWLHLLTAGCLTWIVAGGLLMPRDFLDRSAAGCVTGYEPVCEEFVSSGYLLLFYLMVYGPFAMAAVVVLMRVSIPDYVQAIRGQSQTAAVDNTQGINPARKLAVDVKSPASVKFNGPLY